jgi:hypothetical protein
MKTIILLAVLLFIALMACNKQEDEEPVSVTINYEYSFSTNSGPLAIEADKDNGHLFVVGYKRGIGQSANIQKFTLNGEFINTIVDFDSLDNGMYDRYIANDMCLNNGYIFALAYPLVLINDEYWHIINTNSFSILHFDLEGNLLHEKIFEIDDFYAETIACSDNYIYISDFALKRGIVKIERSKSLSNLEFINITTDVSLKHLISDVYISSRESVYMTGQAILKKDSIDFDFSGCHVTILNGQKNQTTFYSISRTGVSAAAPNIPGIALNEKGYIYLATGYGSSLEIYDQKNRNILIEQINTDDGQITHLTDVVLFNGNIYLLDSKNSKVHVYNEKYE